MIIMASYCFSDCDTVQVNMIEPRSSRIKDMMEPRSSQINDMVMSSSTPRLYLVLNQNHHYNLIFVVTIFLFNFPLH